MGFLDALKDTNITLQANSQAEIKKAECERDASNYQERQATIRTIIGWVGVLIIISVIAICVVISHK